MTQLNLKLAWDRIHQEGLDRGFVQHPYEKPMILVDLDAWLNDIDVAIKNGGYAPSSMAVVNVPKGRGAVRPGAMLSLRDQVIYYALVGKLLSPIMKACSWHSGIFDFAHQFGNDVEGLSWIGNYFKGWSDFRTKSLELLQGKGYAVMADITGYYENVELSRLASDLKALNCDSDVVDLLMKCLNNWAQVPGRGLPQGLTPSDFLGKLYLNAVDRLLHDEGFVHRRYVDDFRIFCNDRASAKRAMIRLTELLRHRGLTVQSAKTAIHRDDTARLSIDGVTPTIQSMLQKYKASTPTVIDFGGYTVEVESGPLEVGEEIPAEVLREAYNSYFIVGVPAEFDKTLFHFLIRRLGDIQDRFAFEHCLGLLEREPQETAYLLKYFSKINAIEEVQPALAEYMSSKESVYDYQIYQIVNWALIHVGNPANVFVDQVRFRALNSNTRPYLRSICRAFLGRCGNQSDLERFESDYHQSDSQKEQCELICCLSKQERSRRNSFLARVGSASAMHSRAVQVSKTLSR